MISLVDFYFPLSFSTPVAIQPIPTTTMPNTAEEDALTQALIAQLMADDMGETLEQHNRPIGSSVEDYEDPLSSYESGQLEGSEGEDGTGWGDEQAEGSGSGGAMNTREEASAEPAVQYPGGWDSHTAYSDGLQPAATGTEEQVEIDGVTFSMLARSITDKRNVSDPLPENTTPSNPIDSFSMSMPSIPAGYGPGNVRYDASSPSALEEESAADAVQHDTCTNQALPSVDQGLINVWGPDDMDIDTSSAKNKGKARATNTDEEEEDEDDGEEDDDEQDDDEEDDDEEDDDEDEADHGEDRDDEHEQPTPKAKAIQRSFGLINSFNDDPSGPTYLSKAMDRYTRIISRSLRHLPKRDLSQGSLSRTSIPSALLNTCACDSCLSYPGYKDEDGNEIPLIHIP